ncbi:MAG: molybdenum cofactor synthesis protein [Bacteroidales bacterium]|nr:molybdenum cofactor synthesis protein [Bacteroidales bacterium]
MELTSNRKFGFGVFAENITTEGFPVYRMKPLDRLILGEMILEVTQIGKKCHGDRCNIFKETGDCVMPKEGIFCRVVQPGSLKTGDQLHYHPRQIKVTVITLSDRASKGIYEDKSGPYLEQLLTNYFNENGRPVLVTKIILPDDKEILYNKLKELIDSGTDIIFTTGGTGIGPRDITPDVVKTLIEKEIPGIMELIRYKYGSQNPNALLSRGIAGLAGSTLIYTLPGSPKAVKEYTDEIFKTLEHSFRMIYQIDSH